MSPINSVCVYCGASSSVEANFQKAARDLGGLLAKAGKRLIYGGGQVGLMGQVADSALAQGGLVTGFTTRHLDSYEIGHPGLTELHIVDNMHTRKLSMFEAADAFIVLPGGYGTLDELFETVTWKQLGLHAKPIIVINVDGYWDGLKHMAEKIVGHKFALPHTLNLFQFVPTPAEAVIKLSSL